MSVGDIILLKGGIMDAQPNLVRAAVILLPLIFLATYLITLARGIITVRNKKNGSLPPTVPYAIPLLRHLPAFLRDKERFLSKAITRYGAGTPVRIHILNRSMSLLTGAKNISTLFRNSRDLNHDHWVVQILVSAFGLPKKDGEFYLTDDTGLNAQPHPNSNMTIAEHRIFHLSHHAFATCLTGSSLEEMARQLVRNLSQQLSRCKIDYDSWTEVPDLYATLIRKEVFQASMMALCGSHIFEVIPTLDEDFWIYDNWLPELFNQTPRFLVPAAYRSRDTMKDNIRRWHEFASQNYDVTQAEDDKREWEEFFGARLMRTRQKIFKGMPLSADGLAADDLGMIWATNANAIPAAGWCILELLQRPELLRRVEAEITPCITRDPSNPSKIDLDLTKLCNQPLLQSIYAETLRLRTGIIVCRVPTTPDLNIGGWHFQKDEPIMLSSWFSGRDSTVWNTGDDHDPHPIDQFWAERFVVYPDNPNSGPIKKSNTPHHEKQSPSSSPEGGTFTLANTAGSWIPYGGGQKICPGRHFAKQEVIAATAMFLAMFEVELLPSKEAAMKPNPRYFMFGVMPPAGKFPARVRRRRFEANSDI